MTPKEREEIGFILECYAVGCLTKEETIDDIDHLFSEKKVNIKTNEFTEVENEGMDEAFCEFWRCITCNNSDIIENSNFCSRCGREIIKPKSQIDSKYLTNGKKGI